ATRAPNCPAAGLAPPSPRVSRRAQTDGPTSHHLESRPTCVSQEVTQEGALVHRTDRGACPGAPTRSWTRSFHDPRPGCGQGTGQELDRTADVEQQRGDDAGAGRRVLVQRDAAARAKVTRQPGRGWRARLAGLAGGSATWRMFRAAAGSVEGRLAVPAPLE